MELVSAWCRRSGDTLTPLQVSALGDGRLFGTRDLVLTSGSDQDTAFMVELACVAVAREQRRALVVTPDASSARSRHLRILEGLRVPAAVLLSTRTHGVDDDALLAGAYAVAVVSAAKLRSILVRCPGALDGVALLAFEAIDRVVHDPDLDVILTHARQRAHARLLGLSSAPDTDHAHALARWLGADLLTRNGVQTPCPVYADTGSGDGLADLVLHTLAAGLGNDLADVRRVGLTSFRGHCLVRRAEDRVSAARAATDSPFDRALKAALLACENAGLVHRSEDRVGCTRRGLRCATLGLDVASACQLAHAPYGTPHKRPRTPGPLATLAELCLSPAGRVLATRAGLDGDAGAARARVLQQAEDAGEAGQPVFRWVLEDLGAFEASAVSALELFLTLRAFLAGDAPETIATRHGLTSAALHTTVHAVSWLAATCQAIANVGPHASGVRAERDEFATLSRDLAPAALVGVRALLMLSAPPARQPAKRRARRSPTRPRPSSPPAEARTTTTTRANAHVASGPLPEKTPRWSPYGVIWVRPD